jgi:hypothetical protein
VDPTVEAARSLRGIRLGVTTTAGTTLGGDFCRGEPRTLAIGEAFHRGLASIGISPPVPVPRTLCGLWLAGFDRGVKKGI